MLLNFNMNAHIVISVADETIKEVQDLFNRIKRDTPDTYRMLCKSLKDGFEYGSKEHIYQYLQWILERDLKWELRDGMRNIANDFTTYLDNKCLSIDLHELTVSQVVICDYKKQEDK